MEKGIVKLPKIEDLVADTEMSLKQNALSVILNQPPPDKWLNAHPTATIENEQGKKVPLKYIPVQRVEWLLTSVFGYWQLEILTVQAIANSVVVTVRLYVKNPITGEVEHQDGVGACPIQTEKGAGAMDWNKAKSNGVMIGAPAAESYAFKDAAEKFGKLFGRDIARKDRVGYENLLKKTVSLEDVKELYELKKEALTPDDIKDIDHIIQHEIKASYKKVYDKLSTL